MLIDSDHDVQLHIDHNFPRYAECLKDRQVFSAEFNLARSRIEQSVTGHSLLHPFVSGFGKPDQAAPWRQMRYLKRSDFQANALQN